MFAGVAINACESGPEGPADQLAAEGFAPRVDSSKLIFVLPVEGANGALGMVLADAIAASLRDDGKPAVLAAWANKMGPTIAGRIIAAEERDSLVWVTARWELLTPYGTAVAEYRQQVVVDKRLWLAGSPEAINLLVADADPRIAAMVADFISPAAFDEAEPAPPAADPGEGPGAAKEQRHGAGTIAAIPESAEKAKPGKETAKPKAVPALAGAEAKTRAKTKAKTKAKALDKPFELKKKRLAAKAKNRVVLALGKGNAAPTPRAKPGKPRLLRKISPKPKRKPAPPKKREAKSILKPVPEAGRGVVPNPPPVAWGRPSFLIKPVEGAPGDGNVSLTRAIKAALRKRDLTVTEDPRQASYVIRGFVEMGTAVNGRQKAKIVWSVSTVAGQEVGKAVQENAVKAGSLDGAWGRIADIVSNAAVSGIQELFGMDKKQLSNTAGAAVLSNYSNFPDLPRIPGRAMPPPNQ